MRRGVERILSHQKLQKEVPLGLPKKLEEYEVYQDLSRYMEGMSDAHSELQKFSRMVEDSDGDLDYKGFLLSIFKKEDRFIQNKRLRENDDARQCTDDYFGEEENDPQYNRFLKCLKMHGNSYLLEYERDGKHVVFKYEEKEKAHLYENGDAEPRRKLRSDVTQTIRPSNQVPDVGNQHRHGSQSTEGILRHGTEIEEEENAEHTTDVGNQVPEVGNRHKLGSQSTEGILRHKTEIEEEENAEYTTDEAVPNSDNLTCYTAKVVDERDTSLDRNCDLRPRTRLRSAMKLRSGSSNSMPSLERRHRHDVETTYKTKNLTGKNTKFNDTSDIVPDTDYLNLLQHSEVINGKFVYIYEGIKIVYEASGEENIEVKQEHDDGSYSDVEILDSTSVCKMNENTLNAITARLRQQLIKVLEKKYDKQEYDNLWSGIILKTPQLRHLELRNGRDLSCTKHQDGKSYLDHFPDLNSKLKECEDDEPQRLNLLRCFFFWLENTPSDTSFIPWNDEKCLAIRPQSF